MPANRERSLRTCIICGDRAGSREHIFPAALGGRRTNRGIYCGTHNNALAPLADTAAQQLRFLNALLTVRPDHAEQAQPFLYTTPEGESFRVFDGIVRRVDGGAAKPEESMLRFTFGGPDGLRSVAYIALTFFAHHFPVEVRQPGLEPLKNFVFGVIEENTFAWWVHEDIAERLPNNPFEFGHSIVLTTVASTGEVSALISLFHSLHFGVALGRVNSAEDASIVVFVDPCCDHPPDDIRVLRRDDIGLAQIAPIPLQAHLIGMVEEGVAHSGLQQLMQRIEHWKFCREMTPIQEQLNALRSLPIYSRAKAIEKIVGGQPQRIFRLMRYVARSYEAKHQNFVSEMLSDMVEADETSDTGLSPLAHAAAMDAGAALVQELNQKLDREDIDMDYLWMLFSGGPGAARVARAMFAPILAVLESRLRE